MPQAVRSLIRSSVADIISMDDCEWHTARPTGTQSRHSGQAAKMGRRLTASHDG